MSGRAILIGLAVLIGVATMAASAFLLGAELGGARRFRAAALLDGGARATWMRQTPPRLMPPLVTLRIWPG